MLSQIQNYSPSIIDGEILEKIIINNDISSLNPIEKVQYVTSTCKSLRLNPLTRPIQLIKFQGKEILYFTKDATEQIRREYGISVTNIESKIINDIYIVTAYVKDLKGREDSSTGAVNIKGITGDALANAMMKAETKSKRRATLSICGLGALCEDELDTMKGAQKIDIFSEEYIEKNKVKCIDSTESSKEIKIALEDINKCDSITILQDIYKLYYKKFSTDRDMESLKIITEEKDKKKQELISNDFDELDKDIQNV